MPDTEQVFKENLIEALKQVNQYVLLGLGTSASALALALNTASIGPQGVSVPGAFVPLDPHSARNFLLVVCILAGAMASYSAEWATVIAKQLESTPELLRAVCTYPCFATSVYPGVRYLASLLPFFLSMTAVLIPALHQNPFPSGALRIWAVFLIAPYLALASYLRTPIGNAWIVTSKKAETTD
jgi:hypothetical protein